MAFSLVILVFIGLVTLVVLGGVVAVAVALVRQRSVPPSLPSAAPLSVETVETISQLVGRERHIEAIKVLRSATGMGLVEAKNRIDGWSDVLELRAAQGRPAGEVAAPGTGQEQVRIEAGAVLAASGWHTAEAFLREKRGLSPEAAKALLDSLS